MAAAIPDDVRQLIESSIDSIRQLDVLLAVREVGTSASLTVSELNARLRSSETALEADLAGLLAANLVETVAGPPTAWRYAPGQSGPTVDRLAQAYRTHRTSVIRLITTGGGGSSSMDLFANSFRIRRKDQSDG